MAYSRSSINDSSLFETKVGALNIAPIKISGQYKIVLKLDGKLYLDDYCGRQVRLYNDSSYIEQIAKFLQISNEISEFKYLRYGAFRNKNILKYNMPFYFSQQNRYDNKIPNLAAIFNVYRGQIDNEYLKSDDLNIFLENGRYYNRINANFTSCYKIYDLDTVGITSILNEINNTSILDYPIYLDWANRKLTIYGISIETRLPKEASISLTNYSIKNTSIEDLNKIILETFVSNKMFYPRFVNIEIEFAQFTDDFSEYDIPFYFNNYSGGLFYSEKQELDSIEKIEENTGIRLKGIQLTRYAIKEYQNYTEFKKIPSYDSESEEESEKYYNFEEYKKSESTCTITEIHTRLPQKRFKIFKNKINVGDTWKILKYNSETKKNDIEFFSYTIEESDIKTKLLQTVKTLCNKLTRKNKNQILFEVTNYNDNFVTVKCTIKKDNKKEPEKEVNSYLLKIPNNYEYLDVIEYDNFKYYFHSIIENDIMLCGSPKLLSEYNIITIDEKEYSITNIFKIDDKIILRLSEPSNIKITTKGIIYEIAKEKMVDIDFANIIPFMNYHTNLQTYFQYDREALIKYDNSIYYDLYSVTENTPASIPAFYDKDSKVMKHIQLLDDSLNNENVENMLFATVGSNTFLLPNLLNLDMRFWLSNGNPTIFHDYVFSWFLIENIIGIPRYFNKTEDIDWYPYDNEYFQKLKWSKIFDKNNNYCLNVTSNIYKLTESVAETVFLGVKYQMDIKWVGYKFSVMFVWADAIGSSSKTQCKFVTGQDDKLIYKIDIDSTQKQIILYIIKSSFYNNYLTGFIMDLSEFYICENLTEYGGYYVKKASVKKFFEQFTPQYLIEYLTKNKLTGQFDNVDIDFNLNVILSDTNYCTWKNNYSINEKLSNSHYNMLTKKLTNKVSRMSGIYLPYFKQCDDLIEFQIEKFNRYNSLMTLWDKNFGSYINNIPKHIIQHSITGVGYIKELEGNLVSTLWNINDLFIVIDYVSEFDLKEILLDYFKTLNIYYNSDSITSNETLNLGYSDDEIELGLIQLQNNKNAEEFAYNQFVNYFIDELYEFSGVTNENNVRLDYKISKENNYKIIMNDKDSFGQSELIYSKLKLLFTLK